jgi:hypothetical protein
VVKKKKDDAEEQDEEEEKREKERDHSSQSCRWGVRKYMKNETNKVLNPQLLYF